MFGEVEMAKSKSTRKEDDLSDLIDDVPAEAVPMPDRAFLYSTGEQLWQDEDPGDDCTVEYLRADAVREGFTVKIWQAALRFAASTAGQPQGTLQRVKDLVEAGR